MLARTGELFVHRQLGDRFGEDHVRTRLHASDSALNGGVQSFDGQRISTRHDHELVIRARIDRCFHTVHHLLLGNDFFVRTMTATLRTDLIFDMECGGTEFDHRFHGASDIECRRTKTGIDIDQQRQIADIGDATHIGQHIIEVGDAEIGQAERASGHATARQVDRAETRAFGQQRVIGINRADYLQRRFFLHRQPELGAGCELGHGNPVG
jgi:hypothetical protein